MLYLLYVVVLDWWLYLAETSITAQKVQGLFYI